MGRSMIVAVRTSPAISIDLSLVRASENSDFKRVSAAIRAGARSCLEAARAINRTLSDADIDGNAKDSDLDDRVFEPRHR